MKKYSISLSFQCSEDWNQMGPAEKGRHCGTCNKVVIDFSSMGDEEIVKYLLQNKNSCGRFHTHQLARPMLISSYKPKSNWPAIAAMLLAGLVSVIPTSGNAKNTVHGNIDPTMQTNTTAHGGTIMLTDVVGGYTYSEPINKPLVVEPDSAKSYYIIHLFDETTKLNIHNGAVTIDKLGIFATNANGDIVLENIQDKIFSANTLQITVSAAGYETKVFTLQKENLKNSTSANLYLTQMQMKAGIVAIDEINIPEK